LDFEAALRAQVRERRTGKGGGCSDVTVRILDHKAGAGIGSVWFSRVGKKKNII